MIEAWLEEKYYVILDRYTYSNIAYQCAKMSSAEDSERLREWILRLEFEHFAIPRPDINIFLDVPFRFTEEKLQNPRHGDDRGYLQGNRDIHESSLDFQRRVREVYVDVAKKDASLNVISCQGSSTTMMSPGDIFNTLLWKN